MSPRARGILLRISFVPAGLLAAFGLLLLSDVLREPPPVPSTPVRRTSAIDRWAPRFPEAAAAPADGEAGGADAAGAAGAARAAGAPALPARWLVVGWDGADWDEILPMIEAGELPNLARLMREGAYGALATIRPTLSPVVWTTVATGEPPERHGIEGFERPTTRAERRLRRLWGGRRHVLYSNADRNVPALWNLLSGAGKPVLVDGYHNTYPAERVQGLMVSSFLMQEYKAETLEASGGSAASAADRLVFPPSLAPEVLALEADASRRFPAALDRFADLTPADRRRVLAPEGLDPIRDQFLYFLRFAFVYDTFDAEVAEAWLPRLEPAAAFVHFQAIDIASHYYMYFRDPGAYASVPLDPSCRAALDAIAPEYRKTLPAFTAYLDGWLGRLRAAAPAGTAVMVLSDHGFDPVADCHTPGGHDDGPPGILVMAGPGIRPGTRIDGASVYDVFPTLAATLGLPLAKDLPGRPLARAFVDGSLDATRIPTVAAYAAGTSFRPAVAPPGPPDPEIEKRLRSLGYVH